MLALIDPSIVMIYNNPKNAIMHEQSVVDALQQFVEPEVS
jgi:hypothetical protein